jgi:serine/threonine protein kinase
MTTKDLVIVKVLSQPHAGLSDVVARFHDYFEKYQQIGNLENLVQVKEVSGMVGKEVYVVQEYFDGQKITDFLRDNPNEARNLFLQACEGLHIVHNKSLYHLKLVPRNILVNESKVVKLTGFGSLAVIGGDVSQYVSQDDRNYVAPEVLSQRNYDQRADIYSLGKVIETVCSDDYPSVKNHPVVEKALERDATNRYTKIREFESQLEEIFKGGLVISPSPLQPPTPTPPTPTPTPLPTPAHPEPPPLEVIREFLQQAIAINGYLDKETERKVLSEATQRGVLADDARFLIEAELETSGAVSERLLLEELERQLHIKTDRDKVLDKKEYDDIIGIVTKAKPGKKRGLKLDVAQKHIQDFCITHGVKVKLKKKRFGIF